jgi:hypothetical protein
MEDKEIRLKRNTDQIFDEKGNITSWWEVNGSELIKIIRETPNDQDLGFLVRCVFLSK